MTYERWLVLVRAEYEGRERIESAMFTTLAAAKAFAVRRQDIIKTIHIKEEIDDAG